MYSAATSLFGGDESQRRAKTVNEAKKFFKYMDRDGTGKVTWYEYWRFVQSYLKYKNIDPVLIDQSKYFFQAEFKKISGERWFFTNEDAVNKADKHLTEQLAKEKEANEAK